MVRTRIDLKLKIKEKLEEMQGEFKTQEIVDYAKTQATNVWTNPHRIAKYIKAADIAEFNKSRKVWTIKTKSFGGMRDATKRP